MCWLNPVLNKTKNQELTAVFYTRYYALISSPLRGEDEGGGEFILTFPGIRV